MFEAKYEVEGIFGVVLINIICISAEQLYILQLKTVQEFILWFSLKKHFVGKLYEILFADFVEIVVPSII